MKRLLLQVLLIYILGLPEAMAQCTYPPIDDHGYLCDKAIYLCGYDLNNFSSTLPPKHAIGPQPLPGCPNQGEVDNIQWFSFIPDDTNLSLQIDFSSCFGGTVGVGLQVGMYNSCDFLQPKIACHTAFSYETITLIADPSLVIPGQIHYLFVDGYGGGICDFDISVLSGVCTDAPDQGQVCDMDCGVESQLSNYTSCTQFTDRFTFDPISSIVENLSACNPNIANIKLDDIMCIEWEISPASGYTVISGQNNYLDSIDQVSRLLVRWEVPGTYTIRPIITVNPLFAFCNEMCDCTQDVIFTLDVVESTEVTLPPIDLCPGDCVEFCGTTYCDDVEVTCLDRNTCSILHQDINIIPRKEVDLGQHFVCSGECFDWEGVSYCIPSNYSVPSGSSCDTFYNFELIALEIDVTLSGDPEITCIDGFADILSDISTTYDGDFHFIWEDTNGVEVGTSSSLSTSIPGVYMLRVIPVGLEACEVTSSFEVGIDINPPVVTASADEIDCINAQSQILLNTLDDIVAATWAGPNGFSSTTIEPTVFVAGEYNANLTAANGCTSTISITVDSDVDLPEVQVNYTDFTCTENINTATFTTLGNVDSYQWILPDATTSNDQTLVLSGVGSYQLEVIFNNGCTSTTPFDVLDLSYDPSLGIGYSFEWKCDQEDVLVDISQQAAIGNTYEWIFDLGSATVDGQNLLIQQPGDFVLVSTDPTLGCVGRDTIHVMSLGNPLLSVELQVINPSCHDGIDGSITIVATDGGMDPMSYTLNGVTYVDLSDIALSPGSYEMETADANGCRVTSTFDVVNPEVLDIGLPLMIEVVYGVAETLIATPNIDDSLVESILWMLEDGTVVGSGYQYTTEGLKDIKLVVELTNVGGCTVRSIVSIVVDYHIEFFIPNVFSPNGDGHNDIFSVYTSGILSNMDEIIIFDRAGEKVYARQFEPVNEVSQGWDGRFNGKYVESGVYVYFIKYKLPDGVVRTLTGSVTVMR